MLCDGSSQYVGSVTKTHRIGYRLNIGPTKEMGIVTVGFLRSRCCTRTSSPVERFSLTEHVSLREINQILSSDPDPLTPPSFREREEKVKRFFRRGREVWEIPESSRTTAGSPPAISRVRTRTAHVFLRGRRKSVINLRMESSSPEEVEAVLDAHPECGESRGERSAARTLGAPYAVAE